MPINYDQLDQSLPYLIEHYKNNSSTEVNNYIGKEIKEGAIFIDYDPDSDRLLIHEVIEEIYKYYQLQSPSNLENEFKVVYSMIKAGAAVGTLAGVFGPFIGFGITGAEILSKKMTKRKSSNDPVSYLKLIAKNKENLDNPESIILKSLEILINISKSNRIIISVRKPQEIQIIDLQFIRTYFSLFKNRFSESKTNYYHGISDFHKSKKLLVLFNWDVHEENLKDVSNELKHFRWFVRRYQLCKDYQTNYFPLVVTDGVFVGRDSEISELELQLNHAFEGQGSFIRIKGGSGTGKSSLANHFIQQAIRKYNHLEVSFIKTDFSGAESFNGGSLSEIKNALNHMNLKFNDAVLNKILQFLKNKEFSKLDQLLTIAFDVQSLLSPFVNTVQLVTLLGHIGKVANSKDLLDYFISYYKYLNSSQSKNQTLALAKKQRFSSYQSGETETIIDEILQSFIKLLQIAREREEYVVWIVDDIQWADKHSATFFNKLLTSDVFTKLPIYLIFLDREDNQEYIRKIPELQHFREVLAQNTKRLSGFTKPADAIKLIDESIKTSNSAISIEVGTAIYNWLTDENAKKEVEPFFVVECLNLIGMLLDGKVLHKGLFSEKWSWLTDDVSEVMNFLEKVLNEMEENFSTSSEAIIQEKIHHIEKIKGKMIAKIIESGSFIGEPFLGMSSYDYVNKLYSSDESYRAEDLIEVEKTYNIVVNIDEDLETYYFSHAIYKSYLKNRHEKNEDINKLHRIAFEVLHQRLENGIESNYYNLVKLQCALHGVKTKETYAELVAADYLSDLASDHLFLNNILKAEEYSDLAKTIYLKHSTYNDKRVIALYHTLISVQEDINVAYDIINEVIENIVNPESLNSFEMANLLLLRADVVRNVFRKEPSKILDKTDSDLKQAHRIGKNLKDTIESKLIQATYHFERGTILGNLGTAKKSKSIIKKGNNHYLTAIDYFKLLEKENVNFNKRLLLNSYIGVGQFYQFMPIDSEESQKRNNMIKAKRFYEMALALTDSLIAENMRAGVQAEMILCLNLSGIYHEERDNDSAIEVLDRIIDLYEQNGQNKQNYLAMLAYYNKFRASNNLEHLFWAVVAFNRILDLTPYVAEQKEWMAKICGQARSKLTNTKNEFILEKCKELNINFRKLHFKAKKALKNHKPSEDGYE